MEKENTQIVRFKKFSITKKVFLSTTVSILFGGGMLTTAVIADQYEIFDKYIKLNDATSSANNQKNYYTSDNYDEYMDDISKHDDETLLHRQKYEKNPHPYTEPKGYGEDWHASPPEKEKDYFHDKPKPDNLTDLAEKRYQ